MKKILLIAVATLLLMTSCSSQYYNGLHKSRPKHTCQVQHPDIEIKA